MAAPASGRAEVQHGCLTKADKKYTRPTFKQSDLDTLKGKKVLDIGPGLSPFPAATEFVEWQRDPKLHGADTVPDLPGPVHLLDLNNDPLPFADKSFDFIWCRHVLEDMHNPFPLIKEMERVGNMGYIETPSPIAELGLGVDVGCPMFRGYHHHRFIVWIDNGTLTFVTKYPVVEYFGFRDDMIVSKLREGPRYWNTCFPWQDKIKFKHMQNPVDYYMPTDYGKVLERAMGCT